MSIRNSNSQPLYPVLFAVSIFHLMNDTLQSVLPALFPIIEAKLHLNYSDLGYIIFCNYISAAIMQPVIGAYTDKHPVKYLLFIGACFSCFGIYLFSTADAYSQLLVGAVSVGIGSSIFHPEASRIVVWSASARKGLSQSIFQIGGNAGQALGPLLILLLFKTTDSEGNSFLLIFAVCAVFISLAVSKWHAGEINKQKALKKKVDTSTKKLTRTQKIGLAIIIAISLGRSWYSTGITGYYALYLMKEANMNFQNAQFHVFVFMIFAAFGTFAGGPIADRFGKKRVLIWSILFALPFTSILSFIPSPYSYIVLACSGFFLVSGFAVALIYLFGLIPGRTGWVSGIMFGLAFGLGGVGSILFGKIGDAFGLSTMMFVCSLIPLIGLLVFFLPDENVPDSGQ
ncbi:MAG: FSR family fosmidomycin resistance protein-like MFS transporter [Saprospiraceae bacterium]|jgi:FSR family fosmidomycin resistance protein-like MFS transporter